MLRIKQTFLKNRGIALFTETIKERTVKLSENITNRQIEELKLTTQVSLFVRRTFEIIVTQSTNVWSKYSKYCNWVLRKKSNSIRKVSRFQQTERKVWQLQEMGLLLFEKKKIITRYLLTIVLFMRKQPCAQRFPEEIWDIMELVIKIKWRCRFWTAKQRSLVIERKRFKTFCFSVYWNRDISSWEKNEPEILLHGGCYFSYKSAS